ncbi:MAG: sodium-translocating pyrophosphatase [Sandaracinaceae bacterium]|nr:sodium-translocating pyrophosphatase [Sandaracinaceae bacterium]
MEQLIYTAPAAGVAALIYAVYWTSWVKKQDAGDQSMRDIAEQIQTGAMAFIKAEYRVLAVFVVCVAALLAAINMSPGQSPLIAAAFVVGAGLSAIAGWAGMRVATYANVRTTAAARLGLPQALNVAFKGGSVMGMTVVGLALIGMAVLFIAFTKMFPLPLAMSVLTGFSMGASSIALFARVGGGIYTKAADVGADLVGKIEEGLPEDDPRNPAVIADNVGDNVGDVAGMGADLFESYVGAIIGAMVLGLGFDVVTAETVDTSPVLLPLVLAAAGIICSILGTFVVKTKEGGNPQHALDAGAFGAAGVMAVATFGIAKYMWPVGGAIIAGQTVTFMDVGIATVVGLLVGVAIGMITSYYCSMDKPPVDSIAEQTKTGPATTIITGLAVGMSSTAWPVILIGAGVILADHFAGLYGVAIAALGMLSTTGIQLAVDAYGPIADNAGGIAEMSHQAPEVRERTDKLDAVGNTTAAIGKGFAIGSAAMTALALFAAFAQTSGIDGIDITKPVVMAGLFVGGMLPFLFSAMAMSAVGEAAMEMIEEVRRQFREIPGLLEGTAKPDTAKCVDISTKASLKRMQAPGALAIVTPVVVGFGGNLIGPGVGAEALGGLLAGVTVSGVCMAIFMSNAGGAWDNAKKSFEGGGYKMKNGTVHPKGSPAHNAAVVGDTVGDPFKDTAGPSLNILVKLMSVVALVIAPNIAAPASTTATGDEAVITDTTGTTPPAADAAVVAIADAGAADEDEDLDDEDLDLDDSDLNDDWGDEELDEEEPAEGTEASDLQLRLGL